jgi:poly(A) polymerase/tRNA nucleotidyltransferase (CCA-adding enzyme)
MGVKCDFKGNFTPVEVRKMLRQEGLPTTSLNMDVYARDFTMNMLVYDIRNGTIYDVCKQSIKDVENNIIRTYFKDVDELIRQNPLIILRALKYVIRYDFLMDSDLRRSVTENQQLLFESDVSRERIGMGFLELISENENQAIQTLKEYGLLEKCKEYINYANAD